MPTRFFNRCYLGLKISKCSIDCSAKCTLHSPNAGLIKHQNPNTLYNFIVNIKSVGNCDYVSYIFIFIDCGDEIVAIYIQYPDIIIVIAKKYRKHRIVCK